MNLVETIYDLRQTFAIIGLTGRTGSGCSTVAELIKDGFDDLDVPPSYNNKGISNDDRKYRVEYNFLKTIWKEKKFEFKIIKASDIIFFYALKEGLESFVTFFSPQRDKRDSTQPSRNQNARLDRTGVETLKNKLRAIDYEKQSKLAEEIDKFLYEEKYKDNTSNENRDKTKEYIKFFDEELPKFRKEVFVIIDFLLHVKVTALFQSWGDNVRRYGRALEISEKAEEANDPSKLAQTINKIIKMIRRSNSSEVTGEAEKPTFVIIDSLRNPYEVLFFRERYAAFYLASVNTKEEYRIDNLLAHYALKEIKELDEKEYPSKRKEIDPSYYSQDVEKCVELSEIHIVRDNKPARDNDYLKKQIIHFISLILHPGLVQPTPLERLMQIAYTAKLNSGCISRQVGAVVTDANYSVKSVGWNTVAKGQTPCNLRDLRDLD